MMVVEAITMADCEHEVVVMMPPRRSYTLRILVTDIRQPTPLVVASEGNDDGEGDER